MDLRFSVKTKRPLLMVSVLLFLVFGFLFSAEPAADPRVRFRFPVMGTEAVVILFAPQEQAEKAHQGVKEAFDRVLQIANPYDPESEVSRLNRTASTAPFVCSEDLWTMLQAAREAWKISGGAFDVTARPIMDLWGFYRIAPDRHAPDEKERKEVLAKVGLDKVRFDDTEHSVCFTVPGMALDLGGLAKGYAVDLALEAIRREGITRGSVNLGGNLGLLDPPPTQMGWIIALFAPDRTVADHICLLKNTAVSTSGDYERYILVDGEKIGHIVDPRTGRPVHREYSVSAIASSALRADILSTVFYLDPDTVLPEGEKWAGIRIIRNESADVRHARGRR